MFKKYLATFLLSMVPIIELRGAVILGAGFGLDPWADLIVCIIGSFLPVPFILLFIRKILEWMKMRPRFRKIAEKLEKRAEKNRTKVMRFAGFGLFLFVAIPLPGTGAWTGALVAALMNMRMKYALPAIFFGVVAAGIIMTLASTGVVSFLSFLL